MEGFPKAAPAASAVGAPREARGILEAVLLGGMLVAVLLLTEEISFSWLAFGTRPYRVPQIVAAAFLGRQSFAMGVTSVLLGLTVHLAVAFSVVAIYALASRRFKSLDRHVVPAGLLYGVVVYAVMTAGVLPLSALPEELKRPTALALLNGLLGHALLVGLPTAWAVQRKSRQSG